jgi:acetyl-CoA acetyltransferase
METMISPRNDITAPSDAVGSSLAAVRTFSDIDRYQNFRVVVKNNGLAALTDLKVYGGANKDVIIPTDLNGGAISTTLAAGATGTLLLAAKAYGALQVQAQCSTATTLQIYLVAN